MDGREVVAHNGPNGTIHRLDVASGMWRTSPTNGMIRREPIRSALWAGDRFLVWGGPEFTYGASGTD